MKVMGSHRYFFGMAGLMYAMIHAMAVYYHHNDATTGHEANLAIIGTFFGLAIAVFHAWRINSVNSPMTHSLGTVFWGLILIGTGFILPGVAMVMTCGLFMPEKNAAHD